ncbi:MAG: cation transporter, partial [Deltaproteobacteria bacterium]|nr:cation transporter [Deltaproteobacteria bacterium]
MLIESSDAGDPESFRETELFKKCQEIGIIPRSEAELAEIIRAKILPAAPLSTNGPTTEYQTPSLDNDTLSLSLSVDQMWCPACAWVIEETLRRTPGIIGAACNFATDRVRCDYDPVLTSPQRIIDSIKGLGYEALMPGEETEARERKVEFIRFVVSALLTMNVMMLSFALYSGFFTEFSPETIQKLSWPT